jgi:hypothetical protein
LFDVVVRIVMFALHRHKKGGSWHTATATVGHHLANRAILARECSATDAGYFAQCIFHTLSLFVD